MIPICDDCKWWRDYSEPYEMQQHPDYDGHCILLGIMTLNKTECEHLNEELHIRESFFNDHPNELIESDFVSSPWTKWKKEKMRDELKPVRCGCGGEAHHDSASCWNPEDEEWMPNFWHRVICKNCGTQTKAFYTKAEAVQAWNRAMGAERKIAYDPKTKIYYPEGYVPEKLGSKNHE